ncbi:MAG: 3-phosphoshikimate 1-carboxyvinyltransferase [Filifactoraceae bacterium]
MFGLIGQRLDYSLSKKIHETIRPMEYNLISLSEKEFHKYMKKREFKGINVTIPYKEKVIPYLDEISPEAEEIGAVNTIINKDERLYGYNTDTYGFKFLVDNLGLDLRNKKILILGTGGSSKTAYHVLKTYKPALIHKASRTPDSNSLSYEEAKNNNYYDLIVNTTPVGTYPNVYESPIDLEDFSNCEGVIDLVYNPQKTKFIEQATIKGLFAIGGLDMLHVQAIYANELFASLMDEQTQSYRTIYPSKVYGTPQIPCSKSLTHRSIICATLGNSQSILSNFKNSVDINQTILAMRKLGATILEENGSLKIQPIDYKNLPKKLTIDCKESGTTLRLLIPILSALKIETTYYGSKKLMERPLDSYKELFDKMNLNFKIQEEQLIVGAGLKCNNLILGNLKSSQFASGLLLALPLMKGGTIQILGKLESYSYFNLTIEKMREYGIKVNKDENKITATGYYTSKQDILELDYSQLAFFGVLASINSPLTFNGINLKSSQGDKIILEILKNMGAIIKHKEKKLTISPNSLKAINIDASDCPDLVPILMVLALFAQGKTCIENTSRLKYKESPRDLAMAEELKKLGIKVEINENSIIIDGPQTIKKSGKLDSHNDHRIAMALTILGLSGNHPLEIQNSIAINKSFPDFFKVVEKIKMK